ncbi:RHS repeat domain-containing protein [Paenibacillus tundrae]
MIYVLFNILRSISNGIVGSRPFFSYLPYDREQLAYDASSYRVSRIWNGQRTSYTYDTRNRLLSLIEEALQGEDQGIPDKQANRKVIRYAYDAQGNLLREYQGEQTTTYAYDAFNRTSRVEQADGRVVQHGYDPEGLRIRLDNNGNVRRFVHDGWHVVNELDETERVQASYIRGHEWLTQLDDQGHMAYYVNNIHGDVTHLTGKQGQILNAYTYDAFGNMLSAREQRGNPFRYAGEMQDALTGHYYLRARFYNPQIARFTQEDTYRGDGLNLYAYVANNPIRYVDPSGYAKAGSGGIPASCVNKGDTHGSGGTATQRRNSPGIVTGGENAPDTRKMLHGTEGNVGVIPKDIADALSGRTYDNFDDFRKEFWKTVGNSSYADEFMINGDMTNIYRMRNGGAPLVLDTQIISGSVTYQIHHKTPIHQNGEVFNLNNLVVVTPRYHAEILIPEYHGYNGFKKYFK